MQSIAQVFFLNFITGIDNALIIGSIIKSSSFARTTATLWLAATLTVSRTLCILGAQSLASLPGLKLASGLITLLISFRMIKSTGFRSNPSLFYTLLMVVTSDLTIGLDSVVTTAALSRNPFQILSGVFLAVCCTLFLLPAITKVFDCIPWVQIFAAGMIAEIAVQQMMEDPLLRKGTGLVRTVFPDSDFIHLMAIGTAIAVVFFGTVNLLRQKFDGFR